MSQGLVTYIVLGSEERLKTLKLPVSNREEEYLFANFSNNVSCEKKLDRLVTNSCGNLIVFLPPSAFPNLKAKNALKKIAMLDLSEISKRFYTRIDPQNPLPALIIRTTNLEIF